jgi:thiol-disulfide isomerase/thioredoxin
MSARGLLISVLACALAICSCGSSSEAPATQRSGNSATPPPAASTPPPATNGTPAAQAAPPAAEPAVDPNLWYPQYDWALEVDGKPADEARFYVSPEGKKVLVHVPQLPKSGILSLAAKQVTAIDAKQVTLVPANDTARIQGDVAGAASDYTVEGAQVVFYLGSNRFKITPKQPLEGPATQQAILSHSPLYRRGMEEYVPSASDVAYLRSYQKPTEIVVFFGTWCPHCKVLVPKFMKTMQEANNAHIQVSYVGVPRNFGQYDPARARNITGIPSFLFYRDGREFSRIPGEPADMTIEAAVVQILKASA